MHMGLPTSLALKNVVAARRNSGRNTSTSGSSNVGRLRRGNEGKFLWIAWIAWQAGLPPPNSSRDRQAQLMPRFHKRHVVCSAKS